jgi:hypothetical protein
MAHAEKNELQPHLNEYWCIPPDHNAHFIANMEDILDLYQEPYDPHAPLVCMDETSKQLIGELRKPTPAEPGKPARVDYEYERHGTANIFMFVDPLRGWRRASVTDHRTSVDWALEVKRLLDEDYPDARVVKLVMDNLNTHSIASLYEAFEAAEARRLAKRLEIHYTPKHGSWLNIAEIELRVLSGQCLDRRIPDKNELIYEVSAWMRDRNKKVVGVDWRFTTDDARVKLKRLYPVFEERGELS